MAKLIYRIILLLMIIAAVWWGVHYIMNVRSGENLQHGVELVRDMSENIKETLCHA